MEIGRSGCLPAELWEKAYGRRGLGPPIAPHLLDRWVRALMDASLLQIFSARIGGVTIAFRGELILGDFAYDWIAGSDPAHHSSGANQLLMAEIRRELAGLNLKAWDLVKGKVASIADYKRSFGAKDIPYYQACRSYGAKGKAFEIMRSIRHGRE